MNVEHMVEMVNDIANFFASEPDRAAGIAGVANHLKRYWEPRMRKQIIAHVDGGGHGLSDLAREGVQALARMQKAAA
ncbi:MAG TPA: formate dehydrogenase subunit delta [Rhodanobacteraceae bacterium]|jgi:formate dehydrogenase subunit delta|nr:formate dehydrogenase subunit delta [Rhodanobacteraceae bacterium]